jgi:hypothetical protein
MGNPLSLIDPDGREPNDKWKRTIHANGSVTTQWVSNEGGNEWDYVENFDAANPKNSYLSAQKVTVEKSKINFGLAYEPGKRVYFQHADPAIHSADPIFDLIGLGSSAKAIYSGAKLGFAMFFTRNTADDVVEAVVKKVTTEITTDEDVMMFTSKIGTETVEGVTNFVIEDGKLFLNKLHIQGSSGGKVGRAALWDIAKDIGKQYNVEEIIIQGGKRTTGKYKGKIPSPVSIKVE